MTTKVGQGKAKAFMRPSSCVDHELEGRAQQLHYLMIFFKDLILSSNKGQKMYHAMIRNVSLRAMRATEFAPFHWKCPDK